MKLRLLLAYLLAPELLPPRPWPANTTWAEALRSSYPQRDEADQPAALGCGVTPDGSVYYRPLTVEDALFWAERMLRYPEIGEVE